MNIIYTIILALLIVLNVRVEREPTFDEVCYNFTVAGTTINNRCYDSTSGR